MKPFFRRYEGGPGHAGRAVFLDRDGVICENRHDYVKSWDEFVFIPGGREALARLAQSDLRIVVATNQSAINRGIVPASVVQDIHDRMVVDIEAAGGRVDLVITCPHRPDEGCDCRKPRPGMLLAASAELDLDLRQSYLVGDARSDVEAGQAVGCQCYLVLTGRGRRELTRAGTARTGFRVAADLAMVVEHILQRDVRTQEHGSSEAQKEGWGTH